MPPISGIAGADGSSSFASSVTIASVVIISPAIEAAFCNAVLVTFVGSRIPISSMSPNSPVDALYPKESFPSSTFAKITEPSCPAFVTICLSGSCIADVAIAIPCV